MFLVEFGHLFQEHSFEIFLSKTFKIDEKAVFELNGMFTPTKLINQTIQGLNIRLLLLISLNEFVDHFKTLFLYFFYFLLVWALFKKIFLNVFALQTEFRINAVYQFSK
jgi:hypothetical protein